MLIAAWHISDNHTDFISVIILRIYAYPTHINIRIGRILENNDF